MGNGRNGDAEPAAQLFVSSHTGVGGISIEQIDIIEFSLLNCRSSVVVNCANERICFAFELLVAYTT